MRLAFIMNRNDLEMMSNDKIFNLVLWSVASWFFYCFIYELSCYYPEIFNIKYSLFTDKQYRGWFWNTYSRFIWNSQFSWFISPLLKYVMFLLNKFFFIIWRIMALVFFINDRVIVTVIIFKIIKLPVSQFSCLTCSLWKFVLTCLVKCFILLLLF